MNAPWQEVGLTEKEYGAICDQLGREPNRLELGIYGVMWSEHCSYKNSRPVLKLFPTSGARVLLGPGENAGVIDIGDNLAVAFKMESHNHPSAVEPYQGAATGVGGIIRDIFTMGARPIAVLDSLRFGPPDHPRSRYLLEGVVSGIAGYGNCIGLPTVAGELNFDPSYAGNPLVNVMCIGIMDKDQLVLGRADGAGNVVLLAGAATGRDGLGGVSFASETLGEDAEEKRPAVQVGDPFMEKLLVEACLEVIAAGDLVGIQDLGGAGLSCATMETCARAGTGMWVDLDKVPRREAGMSPLEVMLSESQERMLLVVTPEQQQRVQGVFARWGLNCADIGRVTADGMVRLSSGGQEVAALPAASVADGVPLCAPMELPPAEPKADAWDAAPKGTLASVCRRILSWPGAGSARWVWRQYDHMVRTSTVAGPGAADAAVLRLRGTKKGLAAATDGNGRYCYLDPYTGAAIAVAEAARNLACTGAEPLAITDCLNFGDPNQARVYRQFYDAVRGMSAACRALETPVVGGNVSFYNETPAGPIKPTPIVGAVGLLEDAEQYLTPALSREGELIYLLGETRNELGGSLYQFLELGEVTGSPPAIDLHAEKSLQELIVNAHRQGLLLAAHDLSEGGLFLAVAEMALAGGRGVRLKLPGILEPYQELFSESQSRALVAVEPERAEALTGMARQAGLPCTLLGRTWGDRLIQFMDSRGGLALDLSLAEARELWENALERSMAR